MSHRTIAIVASLLLPGCMSDLGNVGGPGGGNPPPPPGGGPDAGAPEPAGQRVTDGLQVLYDFQDGAGSSLVHDRSGIQPAHDLVIQDPLAVTWAAGGGLTIAQPTIITSTLPPTKLYAACVATNQVTVEAWLRPGTLNQTSARIVSYAQNVDLRNVSLHMDADTYYAPVRTTGTNEDGEPGTESGPGVADGTLQHVVFARDAIEAALYVDGEKAGTSVVGGDQSQWDPSYLLALGNEVDVQRPWLGELFLVAIYCRKLSDLEIIQNFEASY
jgi:hypothetical protein